MIIRDISELAKIEYARSIEKLTEIMIASTSHDMRTPLNTITSMLSLIKNKIKSPEVLKWLHVANNSTSLLIYLVSDTLDFFQIKSNKFAIKNALFDIRDSVNKCFDLIADSMK
jgi:signal transduction histidine kinase